MFLPNVCRAMLFLRECSLLKIEDILPFFPDFATIDHFKVHPPPVTCRKHKLPTPPSFPPSQDAICTSLKEYNAHIDDLKTEMQGATDSAKNIRSDIQDIRNK